MEQVGRRFGGCPSPPPSRTFPSPPPSLTYLISSQFRNAKYVLHFALTHARAGGRMYSFPPSSRQPPPLLHQHDTRLDLPPSHPWPRPQEPAFNATPHRFLLQTILYIYPNILLPIVSSQFFLTFYDIVCIFSFYR